MAEKARPEDSCCASRGQLGIRRRRIAGGQGNADRSRKQQQGRGDETAGQPERFHRVSPSNEPSIGRFGGVLGE